MTALKIYEFYKIRHFGLCQTFRAHHMAEQMLGIILVTLQCKRNFSFYMMMFLKIDDSFRKKKKKLAK